ncbi:MAG: FG-GAP repeat protein [Alphaproteobacteria bacterium]|nr:FG-GAP repeat protein [Alphaproteobacteria bacterium]
MNRTTLGLLALLVACGEKDPPDSGADSAAPVADADGDGFEAPEDCDDANPTVNPAAAERCDEVDQDCDGAVDEGVTQAVFVDADGDGFGDPDQAAQACAPSEGQVLDDRDCDDGDAFVNPAASEACDGVDEDCDGAVDEQASGAILWYADADGDGFGDPEASALACRAPSGHVFDATDCEDNDPAVFPGAEEVCDDGVVNDCGGDVDAAWALCGLVGEALVRDAHATLSGPGSDRFGAALADVGDVNGDGHHDLLVGAHGVAHTDYLDGSAYLFHGPLSGALTEADAAAVVEGSSYEGYLGLAVDGPGDLDGDGVDDLVIGALHPRLGLDGDQGGSVFIFHGPVTGTSSQSDADLELRAGDIHNHVGADLAHGDLDGDGVVDLVSAASSSDEREIWQDLAVWFGPHVASGAEREADLLFTRSDGRVGVADVAVGDLDGDGVGDIVAGSFDEEVLVYSGPFVSGERDAAQADLSFTASGRDTELGATVSLPGDLDGDGSLDLAVTEPLHNGGGPHYGAVFILLGPARSGGAVDASAAATLYGDDSVELVDAELVGAGDHDADGLDDLLVRGDSVYLVAGPISGVSTLPDAAVWRLAESRGVGDVSAGLTAFELDGDPWLELAVGGYDPSEDGVVFIIDGGGY